jgi:hypothetical protein
MHIKTENTKTYKIAPAFMDGKLVVPNALEVWLEFEAFAERKLFVPNALTV